MQILAIVADKNPYFSKPLMDNQVCPSCGVLPGDGPTTRHKKSVPVAPARLSQPQPQLAEQDLSVQTKHHWPCQVQLVPRLVTLGSGSELAAPALSCHSHPHLCSQGNLFRQHTDNTSNGVAGGNSSLLSRNMGWYVPGLLNCL